MLQQGAKTRLQQSSVSKKGDRARGTSLFPSHAQHLFEIKKFTGIKVVYLMLKCIKTHVLQQHFKATIAGHEHPL